MLKPKRSPGFLETKHFRRECSYQNLKHWIRIILHLYKNVYTQNIGKSVTKYNQFWSAFRLRWAKKATSASDWLKQLVKRIAFPHLGDGMRWSIGSNVLECPSGPEARTHALHRHLQPFTSSLRRIPAPPGHTDRRHECDQVSRNKCCATTKMRPKIKLSNLRRFTFNAPRLGTCSWFWGKDADGIA